MYSGTAVPDRGMGFPPRWGAHSEFLEGFFCPRLRSLPCVSIIHLHPYIGWPIKTFKFFISDNCKFYRLNGTDIILLFSFTKRLIKFH